MFLPGGGTEDRSVTEIVVGALRPLNGGAAGSGAAFTAAAACAAIGLIALQRPGRQGWRAGRLLRVHRRAILCRNLGTQAGCRSKPHLLRRAGGTPPPLSAGPEPCLRVRAGDELSCTRSEQKVNPIRVNRIAAASHRSRTAAAPQPQRISHRQRYRSRATRLSSSCMGACVPDLRRPNTTPRRQRSSNGSQHSRLS